MDKVNGDVFQRIPTGNEAVISSKRLPVGNNNFEVNSISIFEMIAIFEPGNEVFTLANVKQL